MFVYDDRRRKIHSAVYDAVPGCGNADVRKRAADAFDEPAYCCRVVLNIGGQLDLAKICGARALDVRSDSVVADVLDMASAQPLERAGDVERELDARRADIEDENRLDHFKAFRE